MKRPPKVVTPIVWIWVLSSMGYCNWLADYAIMVPSLHCTINICDTHKIIKHIIIYNQAWSHTSLLWTPGPLSYTTPTRCPTMPHTCFLVEIHRCCCKVAHMYTCVHIIHLTSPHKRYHIIKKTATVTSHRGRNCPAWGQHWTCDLGNRRRVIHNDAPVLAGLEWGKISGLQAEQIATLLQSSPAAPNKTTQIQFNRRLSSH